MFETIRFNYHWTKAERLLNRGNECMISDANKAKELWDEAYEHEKKMDKILMKIDKKKRKG